MEHWPGEKTPRVRRLVSAAVHRPGWTVAVWLAIAAVSSLGLFELSIDTTITSALNREGAAWATYLRSLDRHGGDEFITVAIEAPEPFAPSALAAVVELSDRLARLPDIRRVDSLATVPLIRPDAEGGVRLDAALAAGVPGDVSSLAALRADVRRDRIAPRSLISADERTLALNVILSENVNGDRLKVVSDVREIVAPFGGRISGVPVFREAVGTWTTADLRRFIPVTVLLIAVLIGLLFRSAMAVVAALAVGAAGAAVCLGAMGILGAPLTITTMVLPSILLALGCAYSMHVLAAARGLSRREELEAAVLAVARPVLLSGLTTTIGFISMATVRITLIRDLAVFGAIGVLVLTFAAVTLAPALLALRPLSGAHGGLDRWIRQTLRARLVGLAADRRRGVLALWVAAFALAGTGAAGLRVSSDVILWFPHGSEVRDSYEAIRARLSGITPVNVLVETQGDRLVTEPTLVASLDALSHHLEELPEVGKALSVADPLRQIRAALLGVDDAGLPASADETEQYLLLLEGVEQLEDVISDDRTSSNVVLRVNNNASTEIVALANRVDDWWRAHGVPGFRVTTTGIMYEFGRAQQEIAWGLLRGLAVALLVIGGILATILRDARASAIALVPNVVPIAITFGLMGLLDVPLDSGTVCFGSLALGIAVDDTTHVMLGYQDRIRQGLAPRDALDGCLERVLPAVAYTTVVIVLGFAVLAVSEFTLIGNLGRLTAGVVALCLLADLTLLPPLLLAGSDRDPG